MKKSERMKTVQAIADRDEQAQATELARLQQRVEMQQAKLAELRQYYREYAEAARIDASRQVDLTHLQESRHFLQKLTGAIAQQKQHVRDAELAVKKQRKCWIDARSRCLSRNMLADRYREAEYREAERVEQINMDDLNNQRFVWANTHTSSEMA
jgi:flagellar protein FliJ